MLEFLEGRPAAGSLPQYAARPGAWAGQPPGPGRPDPTEADRNPAPARQVPHNRRGLHGIVDQVQPRLFPPQLPERAGLADQNDSPNPRGDLAAGRHPTPYPPGRHRDPHLRPGSEIPVRADHRIAGSLGAEHRERAHHDHGRQDGAEHLLRPGNGGVIPHPRRRAGTTGSECARATVGGTRGAGPPGRAPRSPTAPPFSHRNQAALLRGRTQSQDHHAPGHPRPAGPARRNRGRLRHLRHPAAERQDRHDRRPGGRYFLHHHRRRHTHYRANRIG